MSQIVRSAKNLVKGYSSTEILVRNATANTSVNPDRDMLDEIAEKSYNSEEFFEIMDMVDKRLNDKGKYWRHVAKSLTVLDYLVRFGSENCVRWCKENLYVIKTLREFTHDDEIGEDDGQIVRVKAKELTSLLMDDERLREERRLNGRGERRNRSRRDMQEDDDIRRVMDESRRTAEEEARRRKREEAERLAALQLAKEEEELKRLQQLQLQQQQQQQQPVYYDIFGNPISAEEYLQYQQQQQQAQLAQQQLLAQQEQQYWALQQQQQQAFAQQQLLAQQQQQQPNNMINDGMVTGTNNPFARNNKVQELSHEPEPITPPVSKPQEPLKQTRTGNQSITDKYSALNSLLAVGPGIDTFGNEGQQRISAQHTKTGTFINSQGTGYRQVSNDSKPNPFLNSQYTGLPSTSIVPSQTGFGFGNQTNTNKSDLLDL